MHGFTGGGKKKKKGKKGGKKKKWSKSSLGIHFKFNHSIHFFFAHSIAYLAYYQSFSSFIDLHYNSITTNLPL